MRTTHTHRNGRSAPQASKSARQQCALRLSKLDSIPFNLSHSAHFGWPTTSRRMAVDRSCPSGSFRTIGYILRSCNLYPDPLQLLIHYHKTNYLCVSTTALRDTQHMHFYIYIRLTCNATVLMLRTKIGFMSSSLITLKLTRMHRNKNGKRRTKQTVERRWKGRKKTRIKFQLTLCHFDI